MDSERDTPSTKPRRRRKRVSSEDGPDPIDLYVGSRMRLRRIMMGLSQYALAQSLELTFQQVQKYEKGANRISASTLHRLAEVLDVPVSFFFDELPRVPATSPREDDLTRRESLELLRNYYRIAAPTRKQLYELVKAMGRNGASDTAPPA